MIAEVKQKMKDESERFLPEYGLTELYRACFTQEPDKVLIVLVYGKPFLGAIQGDSFGIASLEQQLRKLELSLLE